MNICHRLVLYYYVTGRRSLLSGCPVLLWEVAAGVVDIDILPGGDVITTRGYDDGLQVYDNKSGQKIQHPISNMCKEDMWGVYVTDDGATVAAVENRDDDPGRLHIYTSVNGRWKHQMYNTCNAPQSVACTGDGHFIVGSGCNSILNKIVRNYFMYKYNSHGQQIWERMLSFCPINISTDHMNRILVSNTGGGCVTVYSEDGVEMFSFPDTTYTMYMRKLMTWLFWFPAATDQRKLKPQGLCVDDEDNILVVDGISKSVLLYDPRGQFLKKLVDVEDGPYRVALNNDSYLAVCDVSKLRLYKL